MQSLFFIAGSVVACFGIALLFFKFVVPFVAGYIAGARSEWRKIRGPR